ncbi:MAG: thiamine-phosphate kinase [Phycisphaerae bacterium]|nr:thiamine-phosphate kinase [Phycisphaerae bacterium]
MRENDFIEWLREAAGGELDAGLVPVGPGDDCAVVLVGGERLCVSVDQLIDGVHVEAARDGAEAFGRKAMARALSDVAAMAAAPLAAVASLALPRGFSRDDAEAIHRGRRAVSDAFGCPVVGGDVAATDGPLACSVTVLGRPDGIEPVLRAGARVGDAICATGAFGGAWLTARHLQFAPRIAEARAIASRAALHAMIDASDGLAMDLSRVCRASGVGAEVDAAAVPVAPDAAAGRAIDPLAAALGDGEDYELLFTVAPEACEALLADPPCAVAITRIGRIVAGAGLTLVGAGGRREPLAPTGWEHGT